MKSRFILCLLIQSSAALSQSVYDPNPSDDREENIGCLSSRCISNMVLDNRNIPLVRVAPSFTTRIKFPREVVKCEDDTDTIKVCDADRLSDCDGKGGAAEKGQGRGRPFLQARVKVLVDQGKIQGSVFNMPEVNVLCDFTNGDTVIFYAKISPDPHHIVRFVDKEIERSGLSWLFESEAKGRVIPIELSPKAPSSQSQTVVRFDPGSPQTQKSEGDILERLFVEGVK
jgi:hypothetical protein